VPVPVSELGTDPLSWPSSTAFETLGWAPNGLVRGTYWVEETNRGRDFIVHGNCDVDGDGIPAHYTATKSIPATLVTDRHVY